jgi:probable HAF family extracellular repeat protein
MKTPLRTTSLLVLALAAPATAAQTTPPQLPLYRPIDLGVVPGWTRSSALDVNNKRQVTGTLTLDATEPMAFVWLPRPAYGLPAGMSTLGALPLDALNTSLAGSINDCGQIVGTSIGNTGFGGPPPTFGSTLRGFVWQDGEMRDVGTLAGTATAWSGAIAINQRGTIVGWSHAEPASRNAFATRIGCGDRPQGELADLGALGGTDAVATAVNDKDQVVGIASFASPSGGSYSSVAFFHDPRSGETVELPSLARATFCVANALNDRGVVVGSCQTVGASGFTEHAVLWRRDRSGWSIEDLGTFAGTSRNVPTAIDGQDHVIGSTYQQGDAAGRAFLWIDGEFRFLDDLLVTSEPVQIVWTGGTNDRGDIAATGYGANGEERAFLLMRVR